MLLVDKRCEQRGQESSAGAVRAVDFYRIYGGRSLEMVAQLEHSHVSRGVDGTKTKPDLDEDRPVQVSFVAHVGFAAAPPAPCCEPPGARPPRRFRVSGDCRWPRLREIRAAISD